MVLVMNHQELFQYIINKVRENTMIKLYNTKKRKKLTIIIIAVILITMLLTTVLVGLL